MTLLADRPAAPPAPARTPPAIGRASSRAHPNAVLVAALTANIPDLRSHDVYVCGPDGMTRSVITALRTAKVPRRRIHHESFEF